MDELAQFNSIDSDDNSNLAIEVAPFDTTLRPKYLGDFMGQSDIVKNLAVFIEAAKRRQEPMDHILFYGPPGIGKTTLAHIIGNEFGSAVKITSGPTLDRAGDLAAILTNLQEGDILFIDEIHRLSKTIEEMIYPALEDYGLDIILGKGPSARTVRLNLPRFTLIGATTKIGAIANPLRDRFGCVFRLNYYESSELTKIIQRSAELLELEIDEAACEAIAKRSRGTPRIANRLLKRVRDYSMVHNKKATAKYIESIMKTMGVTESGLDQVDLNYLRVLLEKFEGGPAGLTTMASALGEDANTIEEVIEPFLLQNGLIKKTTRGRTLTNHAEVYKILEL